MRNLHKASLSILALACVLVLLSPRTTEAVWSDIEVVVHQNGIVTGQHTSIDGVRSNNACKPCISYYDSTNHRLMFIANNAPGFPGQWLPPVVVDDGTNQAVYGNNPPPNYIRAGWTNSLVVYRAKHEVNFHIAYNARNGEVSGPTTNWLMYARSTDAGPHWELQVLDNSSNINNIPSIAVSNGNPRVSYDCNGLDDLRYQSSTNKGASGSWLTIPRTVSSAGNIGNYSCLAVRGQQEAIVSLEWTGSGYADLSYFESADWGATWPTVQKIVADGSAGNSRNSIVLDAGGTPHVAYYCTPNGPGTKGRLMYTTRGSNGLWSSQVVDAAANTDIGLWPTIRILDRPSGPVGGPLICVSYYDATNKVLKFASRDQYTGWQREVVDNGAGVADVGRYSSMVTYANSAQTYGEINISYYDATNHDLKRAHRRYDFYASPNWKHKTHVHSGTKSVKQGGCLTAQDNSIYGLTGNNTLDFLRYDACDDYWDEPETIPAGPRGKRVKQGACIATVGDDIYVAKGNNTQEIYRYDTDGKNWTALPAPGFTKGIKGGAMACVARGETSYLCLAAGSSNNEWKRLNAATGSWEACTPASLPASKFKAGTSFQVVDDTTLYLLRVGGSTNEFYALNLNSSDPSWVKKSDLPLVASSGRKKKAGEGASLAYRPDDGKLYALKGNNTLEFWQYDPSADAWTQADDIGRPDVTPSKKVKGGGCLAYSPMDGTICCTIGNNTNEFWCYAPAPESSGCLACLFAPNAQANSRPVASHRTLSVSPNPIRTRATISYSLAKAGNISLKLYDMTGKLVTTLAAGYRPAGNSSFIVHRSSFSAGIYLLKMETDSYHASQKLVIE